MADAQIYEQAGIANPGNQCYFNSTLQALASCPSIYKILLSRRVVDSSILQVIKEQNFLDIKLEIAPFVPVKLVALILVDDKVLDESEPFTSNVF